MSTDPYVTRIVQSWLEEGTTALPDRVLDTVLDQLPATPQRRAWWPARRFRDMYQSLKLATGVAVAVVAVAALGLTILPGTGSLGGSPSALTPTTAPTPVPTAPSSTPVPTPTPASPDASPTASAEDVVRAWPGSRPGENPAGRYSWDPDGDGTAWQGPRAFKGDTSGWIHKVSAGIAFTLSVSENAYRPGPIAETVAGYDATYQTLTPTSEGAVTHVWLVDIDGRKLTVTVESQPNTSSAALAEAKAIVDSIRVERTTATNGFRLTFELLAGWDSG